jgi:hypothetical protein
MTFRGNFDFISMKQKLGIAAAYMENHNIHLKRGMI